MTPFTENCVKIIQNIPSGYVLTYGAIAEMAGNKQGARQVARILHSMTRSYNLPWHRVVKAGGYIAFKEASAIKNQAALMADEGIEVDDKARVDLNLYFAQDYYQLFL